MMPECKTNNEAEGRANWLKFSNAIKTWRTDHMILFESADAILVGKKRPLANAYNALKEKLKAKFSEENSVNKNSVNEMLDAIISKIQKYKSDLK
jgi:hypothetical protein